MAEFRREDPGPGSMPTAAPTRMQRQPAAQVSKPGRKVLVLDDSPVLRLYLKHTLERPLLHCEVTLASDGFEALEAMEAQDFDLIICDLNMPNLDGRDFCKVLRSRPLDRVKRVVIFTSDYHCRNEAQFQEDPLFHFLMKPASAQEIQRLILRELA